MATRRHDQAPPEDAIAMLQEDHRRVRDLFQEYEVRQIREPNESWLKRSVRSWKPMPSWKSRFSTLRCRRRAKRDEHWCKKRSRNIRRSRT